MHRKTIFFLALVATSLFTGDRFCGVRAAEDEKNQAQKYHTILQKRPEPGYLFDRFYNAWLDQSTAESLQDFLQKQVEHSDTTANRLLLAFFHSKQNNDVAAIDEFNKALKSDPANASTWYYKAQAESRTLDFDAAIAALKQARTRKPDAKLAVQIERLLGAVLLRNHQTEEAIRTWKALLAAHPDDEELCEDVIELHLEEGLFKEAAALSEALIARTKDPYVSVTRRLRLGDIHHRSGQRQKAVDVYASTLAQSGQDSWLEREIIAQIEQLFRLEDNLAGLKEQYTSLLKTYPKRVALQRRRCRLLVELGENDEAIKGYRAILELTPGDRGNREEYVDLLSKIGRHELAVKELKALCEQSPKDGELQVRLAKTLYQAKDQAAAIAAVDKYLKISDRSEYTYLRAARLVEGFGGKTEAASLYRKMAETFADSPSAQDAYATFLYGEKKKDEALAIWKKQAQGADVNRTLNIVRALETRSEDAAALELLLARQKDFGNESLYLSQLINTAIRLKKQDQCMPWVKRRVELAGSVTDLETAVAQAAGVCQQCDKVDNMISELEGMRERPVALTCLLAELLESTGETQRAADVLKKPAARGELLAVGQQIRLHTLEHNWAQAADATRRLLELSGGRKSQYVRRLVELYERDSQIDEALKWVETWKRVSPGGTIPWLTEARLRQLQGKTDEAQNTLRKAIQRFENDDDLRVQLAETYQEAGKLRDAMQVYWQLYEKAADVADKLRWTAELAKLAEREGTVPHLVDDFQQRQRNNRGSIVPLLALSEIYRVTNDYENRRQALLAATKIQPDDLQLLLQIARMEEMQGDWKKAIATLERAAKVDKTDHSRQKIAEIYLEFGNPEEGYAMLREIMGSRLSDPRALEQMADSLCKSSEWDRAAKMLREQIANFPRDYRLHYLLAVAYEEAGQSADAINEFVQLLDNQEELPNVKKKPPQPGNDDEMDMVRRMFPEEVGEWIEIPQTRYMAYAHRQNHQTGGPRTVTPGGSSPPSTVSMPQSVEEVRPYAIVHLLTIAHDVDESQQTALASNAKSHGLRNFKLLLSLGLDSDREFPSAAEALEADPNNESLLALSVVSGFDSEQAANPEHLARAFEKFRESHSELALLAAIQAASMDAKYAPLLDKAVVMAAKIKNPNYLVLIGLARSMGANLGMSETSESVLTKEQRSKLVKLLVDWYPTQSSGNTTYDAYAFVIVVSALQTNDDPAALIAMLTDEVARYRKSGSKQSSTNIFTMFGGPQRESLLEPMSFPPQELTNFPPNVIGLLMSGENNPCAQIFSSDERPNWDAEKLEPIIRKVSDPTLRILLANHNDMPKIVDSTLSEMLAKKPPQLDAYLLAAGKAAADMQFEKSAELLEKATLLPMKQELRQRIDAAVVATVLAARDGERPQDNLLKIGRDAALRLRRQRLDPQQRQQLLAALETLGLEGEAKKLEKQMSFAGALSAALGFSSQATPVATAAPTSKDRIDKLLAAGKRDTAAQLLAGEVKAIVAQMIAAPNNAQQYRNQMRELRERLTAIGMTDDVMKTFDAGAANNAARLREHAMVCELFDRKDEARKTYERVLADHAKDDMARMRLLMLTESKDTALVDGHLEKLGDASAGVFGEMLAAGVNDYEAEWNQRFRAVELTTQCLAKLKDRPRADVTWATQIVQAFARSQHNNRGRNNMPSLISLNPQADNGRKADADLLKRRVQLHRELCLRMIEVPELSQTGFQYLLAAAEARGDVMRKPSIKKESNSPKAVKTGDTPQQRADVAEEFRGYAEKALLAAASRSPSPGVGTRFYYSSGDSSEVRLRSPEEYLASRAWKLGDWRQIDTVLLPKLQAARNKEPHKNLAQLVRLYRCESKDFVSLAKEVVKQNAPSRPGMPEASDGIEIVVNVWADRELAVDIRPMVLDGVRRISRGRGDPDAVPFVVCYLERLVAIGDGKQVQDMLEELATIYLGPAQKRIDFIKKNYQPNNVNWGSPNARIQSYFNLLDQISRNGSLVFVVLEHMQPIRDLARENNFSSRVRDCLQRVAMGKPDGALAMLDSSPWLGDLEHFRVLPFGRRTEEWPLVQVLEGQNMSANAQFAPLWKALEDRQKAKPTFGTGLFLAVAKQSTEEAALLEFIGANLTAIKKLPAEQQNDLSLAMRALVRQDLLRDKDVGPTAQAARQWIGEHAADRSKQCLEKVQSAKRIEELGIEASDSSEIGRYLGDVLPDLARNDQQSAQKVFACVIALAEDARRRGRMHCYNDEGQTLAATLLEATVEQHGGELKPELLVFLLDLTASPSGEKMLLGSSARSAMLSSVDQIFTRSSRGPKNGQMAAERRLQQFYQKLGKLLDGRSSNSLLQALTNAVGECVEEDKDIAKLAEWAKMEAEHPKYPALAADLYACVKLRQSGKQDAENAKPSGPAVVYGKPTDYNQHFHKVIQDSKTQLSTRFEVASFVFTHQAVRDIPRELVYDAISVYITAMEKSIPIDDSDHQGFLNALLWIQKDPASANLIGKWREQFALRYLRIAPSTVSSSAQDRPRTLDSPNALSVALRLYLLTGDMDRVNQLFRKYDRTLASSTLGLSQLVRCGKAELAARFFRAHATSLSFEWNGVFGECYDAEIEKNVPGLLDRLPNDGEKLLAEVLLTTMPTDRHIAPKVAGKKSGTPEELPSASEERLIALAKRFKSVKFQNKAIRSRTMFGLIGSEKVARVLAEELAAEYKSLDYSIFDRGQLPDQLETMRLILQRHVANRLAANDEQPFVDTLGKLSRRTSDSDYIFDQLGQPLLTSCLETFHKDKVLWTIDQSKKIAAAMRTATAGKRNGYFGGSQEFPSLMLLSHVHAGQSEELLKWFKNLSTDKRGIFGNTGISPAVWGYVKAAAGGTAAENAKKRAELVRDMLQISAKLHCMWWLSHNYDTVRGDSMRIFQRIMESGAMTEGELMAQGPALVHQLDDEGVVKAALARWLAEKKEHAKAADVFRDAIAAAPNHKSQWVCYWHWYLARSLNTLGKQEEARAVLSKVDKDRIANHHRDDFSKFQASLKPTSKPANGSTK